VNIIEYFEKRIPLDHLRKRLELQVEHSAFRFGDKKFFSIYIENLEWMYVILKFLLTTTGFYSLGQRNTLDYRLNYQQFKIKNLPSTFNNFRILHLSDIHIDGIFDSGVKLFSILESLEYDICVITGDYRFHTYGEYNIVFERMKELKKYLNSKYGTFCILGNHDFIEFVPEMESQGYRFLLNEELVISKDGDCIAFFGIDDIHYYKTGSIKPNLREGIKIMLAHSPESIEEAEYEKFSLYLCGHTHGGQICLPGEIPILLNARAPRKFLSGRWSYKTMQGYTSRGTGSSGLDVRFFCPPEILIHELLCD
jgi:uncharacterized protein